MNDDIQPGDVVAAHGRHDLIQLASGELTHAVTRGRQGGALCGDRVEVRQTGDATAVIESIAPRRSVFMRSDAMRTKALAANIDQVFVVIAGVPPFSSDLVSRVTLEAERQDLPLTMILNKSDLTEAHARAHAQLAYFIGLGYPVIDVSIKTHGEDTLHKLQPLLAHRRTLLLGQSGMGKSSLLNLIVPDAAARTSEISQALQSGRHTTTDARLYRLPDGEATVIDTPGFQEFGLAHLSPGEIERAFRELRPYLGHCRFYNCTHLAEPGCAVRAAVDEGAIRHDRYALFADLTRARRAAG